MCSEGELAAAVAVSEETYAQDVRSDQSSEQVAAALSDRIAQLEHARRLEHRLDRLLRQSELACIDR